jgi:hypothetical protein
MSLVWLPSHGARTLAGLAVGLSRVGGSVLGRFGISLTVAVDEKAHRPAYRLNRSPKQPSQGPRGVLLAHEVSRPA